MTSSFPILLSIIFFVYHTNAVNIHTLSRQSSSLSNNNKDQGRTSFCIADPSNALEECSVQEDYETVKQEIWDILDHSGGVPPSSTNPSRWSQLESEWEVDHGAAFYKQSEDYWKNLPPTLTSVLNGFNHLSEPELVDGEKLLKKLFSDEYYHTNGIAMDLCAGYGRVSRVIAPFFKSVDLVEESGLMLNRARSFLVSSRMGDLFHCRIQDFCPAIGKYSLVWTQWSLQQLVDVDAVLLLRKAVQALSIEYKSYVVVKDNVVMKEDGMFQEDKKLGLLIRTHEQYLRLFEAAGLEVEYTSVYNSAKGMVPIVSFVLSPISSSPSSSNE